MDSLAITDHGVLYGAIEFYIKAKEAGIKPIIGCEMYLTPNDLHSKNPDSLDRKRHHLILLAKNQTGYKNLMKLVSIAHLKGFYYKPRIDKKVLRQHAEGLIGLSACIEGEVPATAVSGNLEKAEKVALEYQEIFGAGNFYLELQHHPKFSNQKIANDTLIKISRKTGIPLVATNDIHYVHKEDAPIQDILLCIQMNRKVDEKDRLNLMDFDLHMLSTEDMLENFKELPEALENTQKIVDQCNLEIKLGETQLPYYEVPEGFNNQQYLRKLCIDGLKKRLGESAPKKYIERMEYELQVIEKTGFADYFLIVQDFVNWARSQKIVVGPGRGSAAGSFVSYLTGITNIDPIKHELLFERFLNPERISMPDVDMDFADDRRDEVLDYVRKKYGEDHVAQIITFGTMAARAAIRDAGRALGFPYDFCDKTAKMIPMFSNMKDALENVGEFKDLYAQNNDAKKLIDSAKRLEGVVRHASMHACGVVITKKPVVEYSPLQRIIGKTEGTVTQYSSSTKSSFVEKIGLLKMDFLGLKNLTIIQNALRIAKKTKGLDLNIDDIPMDDPATFAVLQKAQTTGVFQLESSGMKRYLKQLTPTVFEDIIAMVALYRPGPMDWIPDFIDRKHGRKEIKYLHPKLKNVLEKTYGVAVYQEQIMQIARDLAGFTMGEADVLRKAMGKKIFKLIEEQKEKFIKGAIAQNIPEKIAEKVFAFIEPFAGYGFNRCLTGNTLIRDAKNGTSHSLQELYEIYKNKKNLPEIFTLDNWKLKKSKIEKVFFNGKKEVFRLTTRLGKTLEATGNHPFLTFDGWKNLEELSVGKQIAVNRNFPINNVAFPIENYKLAVLGYLIAEGNLCHPHSFYFYSANEDEIKDYAKNLRLFKNTKATVNRSKSAVSVYAGRTDLKKNSEAVEWIKSLGIHNVRAVNKKLPDLSFCLNKNQLSLLIGKMFQGDGCIDVKRKYPQIFYATSSKILVRQLQHLLLRLDILSTIHVKKFRYREQIKIGYTLTVNRYNNILNFEKGPGRYLIGQKRKNILNAVKKHPILNGAISTCAARGTKDVIPTDVQKIIVQAVKEKGFSLKEFCQKNKLAYRLMFAEKRKRGYTRELVSKIGQILKNEDLLSIANSDIYWDEIIKIEKAGIKETFDLTIEKTHNFVAEDIIVHNSHAACYALIGYQTAYLKAHYPAEFMAALLTSDQDDIDRIAIEVSECREMDIEVLPPDVNESFEEFAVIIDPETKVERIRFGLNAVKNVGKTVAREIVEERKRRGKFKNITDFVERIDTKDLNKKSIEALAKVGAMESFGERNQILASVDIILSHSKNFQKNKNSNQVSLFGESQISMPEIKLIEAMPAGKSQRLTWEKELLGLYISDHPAREYADYFQKTATPIKSITNQMVGQPVTLGGVITNIHKIFLKNQKTMLFVMIEDLTSKIELLIFPKVLENTGSVWQDGAAILATGKISDKDGNFKLLCDSVKKIDQGELDRFERIAATRKKNGENLEKNNPSRINIVLSGNADQIIFKKISQFFDQCAKGDTKVYISFQGSKLETPYRIQSSDEVINSLKIAVPEGKVEIL